MNRETTVQSGMRLPEPLTRNNKDGVVYQRSPQVDKQIKSALGLDPKELVRRSSMKERKSPDFLKEETLVYLIRHFLEAGN